MKIRRLYIPAFTHLYNYNTGIKFYIGNSLSIGRQRDCAQLETYSVSANKLFLFSQLIIPQNTKYFRIRDDDVAIPM